jgi:DNA-directed RNA polymerase specialized sigma24 family protein
MQTNPSNTGGSDVQENRTDESAWELVRSFDPLIKKIVRTAVRRESIHPDKAEDALNDARLLAHKLALKHTGTNEQYRNYLAATLARELRYDPAHLKDALDRRRAEQPGESIHADHDGDDDDDWFERNLQDIEEYLGTDFGESCFVRAEERSIAAKKAALDVEKFINLLPGLEAAIARMAFIEKVSPEEIVKHTGRTPAYIHRVLKHLGYEF